MKEKFIISIISQVVASIGFFFAFYLLFLKLDKNSMGIWSLVNSIINLGFLFINVGLNVIHYQYSSKENSSEYFGTFFTIKFILLLINILVAILLITITSFISRIWSNKYTILLIFLLFSKIFFNIGDNFYINLKSNLKVFRAEIPLFLITIGKSISIFLIALNLHLFSNTVLFLCFSLFLFNLLYLILILLFSKNIYKINKLRKDLYLLYLKYVNPLFIFSIILVIATILGNLILSFSFGKEELGSFSFINDYLIGALLLVSGSIVTVYLTILSKLYEEGDLESVKKITYIIEKYFSMVFMWIIIVVLLNGRLLLSIFMNKYVETAPILYIMIFIPYLISITRLYSYHFIAAKNQKINAIINILVQISIIILMIVLIPSQISIFRFLGLGKMGYAISLIIPWILWFILNRYYSYKMYNIKPQKNIIIHFILAFISLVIIFALKYLIFEELFQNQLILLLITSILSLGIFITFLLIFRELKRED